MSNKKVREPKCCICGGPVEMWPSGSGYGNNPWPVTKTGRCCDYCNGSRVIPARIVLLKPQEVR
jgi:hypothetical protein